MQTQRHVDGEATQLLGGLWSRPARAIATLVLSSTVAGLAVSAALAESPPAATEAPAKAESIEPIVVTGSRISRRDFVSDSPIVTVGQDALAAAGQPTLDKALGQMPQFAAAQGQNEVGDVQGDPHFQGGQSYSDLRGLGPNRTLVLMDGRRLVMSNPDGSIDLHTIPMAMIENVEVITGGASAAYGSDAVAGVVNFKLRQHFSGVQLDYQHGGTTHGDGRTERVSALLGGNFADNRGNAVVALEYAERGIVRGADRPFFADIRQFHRTPEGFMLPGTFTGDQPQYGTINTILAGYPGTTPLSGTGNYLGNIGVNTDGTIYTDSAGANCVQNYRGVGAPNVVRSADCTQLKAALGRSFAIQVPLTKYNLFARSTYNINDDVTAYSQLNFMHSSARDETGAGFTHHGGLTIPTNNPYVQNDPALQTILNSLTTPPATLQYFKQLTVVGPRVLTYDYDVWQALAGLKGDIPGHDLSWDVYASYGRSQLNNYLANDASVAALNQILDGTANYGSSISSGSCMGYAWNPFGAHPLSAGCREFATFTDHNVNSITQKAAEGVLQGKLATLPADDLRFALGADYRGNRFDYAPDHALVTDSSWINDPQSPAAGTQNVREVFGELLIPVLKDAPFAKQLNLDVEARRSQYDGFGGVNTWKADLNWKPIDDFMVRGGYSKSIRAPSLLELYGPTVTGQNSIGGVPTAGDPCDAGSALRTGPNATQVQALCIAQGVPAALYPTYKSPGESAPGTSGGNSLLQPETAKTYSIGAVWRPSRSFDVSVDYFNIKIDQAVGFLALPDILQRCFNADGVSNSGYSTANIYCSQFQRDSTSGDISASHEGNLNLAHFSTDGVDTQIDWKSALSDLGLRDSPGSIVVSSYIGYTRTWAEAGLGSAQSYNYAGSIGYDGDGVTPDISHPRWKANTRVGYEVGPFATALHWRYISAMRHFTTVTDPTSTAAGVPSYSYLDWDAHYKFFGDTLQLNAGVTNITDKQPPFVAGVPLTTDAATYDAVGRSYYVGFSLKL